MSFLSKLRGRKDVAGDSIDGMEELAFEGAYASPGGAAVALPAERSVVEPRVAARSDSAPSPGADSVMPSIISEGAPSEIADFSESRQHEAEAGANGMPLIGKRPVAQQQRILTGLVGIGLLGLIVLTIVSIVSAGRGSAQVASSGQALMQSQRLAKSVSQALVGSPQAFPEVRESSRCWRKT